MTETARTNQTMTETARTNQTMTETSRTNQTMTETARTNQTTTETVRTNQTMTETARTNQTMTETVPPFPYSPPPSGGFPTLCNHTRNKINSEDKQLRLQFVQQQPQHSSSHHETFDEIYNTAHTPAKR